ncbi:diaminopimelate decarboxylase [Helicobacter salomonis]|uniref:diaminopimelate decarboxylase n=1 Tax=Helicobacter salomonis TaxID=56878 RepID=UPI000CF03914|nr:diaminopimelate decarboxylase [Helicobacter salomonis]
MNLDIIAGIAATHPTPFYLYNFDQIEEAFLEFKNAFSGGKSLICYALKANSNLSLLAHLARLGAGGDCVSIYEVRRALLAGIPPYKIIFSGVGKLESEIQEALKSKILFLNVESFEELRLIERIATNLNTPARISVRVNPNIDAQTHPHISTGLWENKFGVEEKEAVQMFMFAKQSPFLEPVGLHCHIGSQLIELEPIKEASEKMSALARFLIASGIELKFLDMGGGLGVDEGKGCISIADYAKPLKSVAQKLDLTLICEPGRRIVADSGVLVSRVQYVKSSAQKNFVVVDAGMNDFVRPALYGARHQVEVLNAQEGEQALFDIVGPVCESADCFLKGVALRGVARGDLLVFKQVGAYGASMASHYNSRPKILELGLEQSHVHILRDRENFFDNIAHEIGHLESIGIHAKRAQIDRIDEALSKLLNTRLALSQEIAQDKQKSALSMYNPVREAQIFKKVGAQLESIYTEILSVSRALVGPEKVGISTHTSTARRLLGQQFKLKLYNPLMLFEAILLKGVDYGLFEVRGSNAYAQGLKALSVHIEHQCLEIAHSFKIASTWCLLVGRFGFLAQENPTRRAWWFAPTEGKEVQVLLSACTDPYFLATPLGCLLEANADLELPTHLEPLCLGTYSTTRRTSGV